MISKSLISIDAQIHQTRRRALFAMITGMVALWLLVLANLPGLVALLLLAVCMGSNVLALKWWDKEVQLKFKRQKLPDPDK